MTTKQSKIFNEILDLNHDMVNENKNFTRKWDLLSKLSDKKEELKKSMGEFEYNKFMNAGQRMFS